MPCAVHHDCVHDHIRRRKTVMLGHGRLGGNGPRWLFLHERNLHHFGCDHLVLGQEKSVVFAGTPTICLESEQDLILAAFFYLKRRKKLYFDSTMKSMLMSQVRPMHQTAAAMQKIVMKEINWREGHLQVVGHFLRNGRVRADNRWQQRCSRS